VNVRRMVPDERRALILRAARDLFSQRPYAEVSVAGIAQAAGVSPPLIVFHYGSKRALYLALLEAAADAIRDGLNEMPGPPSLDRLRAGVRFYACYARDHRAGFLSLLRGGQDVAEAAALVEAFRDELAGRIYADLAAVGPAGGDAPAPGTGAQPGAAQPGAAQPGAAQPGAAQPADVLTMLAVRGYLGYVDAVIVSWLALPDAQRDQVSPGMIANVAAGAFAGGLTAAYPGAGPQAGL
jgi:AcrR family transcriptional regulator